MIDIFCTQRIHPGMEERVERLLQEAQKHEQGKWHASF